MKAETWLVAGLLAIAVPASAQPAGSSTQASTASSQASGDPRGRVASTNDGDAGLWWVPIADTNGKKRWRAEAARISRNNPEGHMNVANFTAAVSYGLGERTDVYASWDVITRADRDTSTLFITTDPERGGVFTANPYARSSWSGNKLGDLRLGTKYALLSEAAGNKVGLAGRFTATLPTAQADAGGGFGAPAIDMSGVLSKWATPKVVVSSEVGFLLRKNPSDPIEVHVPNVWHWGGGIGITPNDHWLIHSEFMGENPRRDNAKLDGTLVATDGSLSPPVNTVDNTQHYTAGVTWFASNGFFIGGEARWDWPMLDRVAAAKQQSNDYLDYYVRIGWSPLHRQPPPPPPVTPTAPTPPPAAAPPAPAPAPRPTPPPAPAPAPAPRVYTFEDVHFDFDRYSLRPEALRVLEQAVTAMKESPTLRLTIEGHTCSIGTSEYNLALGDRRANSVRDYLVNNGVAANRLVTVSYGEERPKHDNSREETRRLNRRAALVVRLEP